MARKQGSAPSGSGVSVLIASDLRLFREGLAETLAHDGRLRIAGTAAGLEEALGVVATVRPDAVLIDMGTPGARSNVRRLVDQHPEVNVVALGVSERRTDIIACAEAGIAGYVCRDSSFDDLVKIIEGVAAGELVCSPRIAGALLRHVGVLANRPPSGAEGVHITPREMEILSLIDQGLSNKQIGARLHIEVSTVKNHVHNILEKLGVHRRTKAVSVVRRAGLLHASRSAVSASGSWSAPPHAAPR